MKDDIPNNINKSRGILSGSTYKSYDKAQGTEPYYTYQGIGNITGTKDIEVYVTFKDEPVDYDGYNVTFT